MIATTRQYVPSERAEGNGKQQRQAWHAIINKGAADN